MSLQFIGEILNSDSVYYFHSDQLYFIVLIIKAEVWEHTYILKSTSWPLKYVCL